MVKWIKPIFVLCFVCLILSIVLLSLVPPVSKDALTHHLFVPKLYLNHGKIFELPWIGCSYYPMNLDLFYIAALYFGSDILPKFIHFTFGLAATWLIFDYLKKRLGWIYASFGAFFFLTIPIVIKLSITVYVDLGLIFFSTSSLLYLFKWQENQFNKRDLIISAVFCGLAIGTKYNGLIILLLISLFVPFIYIQQSKRKLFDQVKAAGYSVLFVLVALTIFSPWMVKNYSWTKNPVYPLYNNLFLNLQDPVEQPENINTQKINFFDVAVIKKNRARSMSNFASRYLLFGEQWWEIMLIPVRVFFQGKDGTGKYFDGKLTPFLFLLPFFAFMRKKKQSFPIKKEKKILLWFSILFLLIVLFTADMRIRYISPIIPPLVMLSTFGLYEIVIFIKNRRSVFQKSLIVCYALSLVCLFSINGAYIVKQFKIVNPIGFLSGNISKEQYITHFRKEYPAIQYVNENLPEDSLIYTIFLGRRGYYFDKKIRYSDINFVADIVKSAENPENLANILKTRGGITHLFINHDLFIPWMQKAFELESQVRLFEFFKQHTDRIFLKNEYGLYAIKGL